MKQELKELIILSRIRAQLHNLALENVLDKEEQGHNVIKALAASLPLLKSESQSIQNSK